MVRVGKQRGSSTAEQLLGSTTRVTHIATELVWLHSVFDLPQGPQHNCCVGLGENGEITRLSQSKKLVWFRGACAGAAGAGLPARNSEEKSIEYPTRKNTHHLKPVHGQAPAGQLFL